MVPREIFELIKATNINLFLTCSRFYHHINVFFKFNYFNSYKDLYYNPNKTIHGILNVNQHHWNEKYMKKYIREHTYKIKGYLPTYHYKFHLLTHVVMHDAYNGILSLPQTVIYLKLGKKFNHPLPYLPRLKKLETGPVFDHLIHFPTLEVLILGKYDRPLLLSPILKELHIAWTYNIKLPKMPDTLEVLILGWKYNHTIDYYSSNLRMIRYGADYTKTIQVHLLPPTLTYMELAGNHGPIDLSSTCLKFITFGQKFASTFILPSTIIRIGLDPKYPYQINLDDLPSSLKIIRIGLERIKLDRYRQHKIPTLPNDLLLRDMMLHMDLKTLYTYGQTNKIIHRDCQFYLRHRLEQDIKVPLTLYNNQQMNKIINMVMDQSFRQKIIPNTFLEKGLLKIENNLYDLNYVIDVDRYAGYLAFYNTYLTNKGDIYYGATCNENDVIEFNLLCHINHAVKVIVGNKTLHVLTKYGDLWLIDPITCKICHTGSAVKQVCYGPHDNLYYLTSHGLFINHIQLTLNKHIIYIATYDGNVLLLDEQGNMYGIAESHLMRTTDLMPFLLKTNVCHMIFYNEQVVYMDSQGLHSTSYDALSLSI